MNLVKIICKAEIRVISPGYCVYDTTDEASLTGEIRMSKEMVIEIGAKVGVKFDPESGMSFNYFLNKVMDRLEGKQLYASEMLVCLKYKQQLLANETFEHYKKGYEEGSIP